MNHKRKKPKQSRAGCLLCKPHKIMGNSKNALPIQRLRQEIGIEYEKDD